MHIKVHIFTDKFSDKSKEYAFQIASIQQRITDKILEMTLKAHAGIIGDATLLDHEGMIVATIQVEKGK